MTEKELQEIKKPLVKYYQQKVDEEIDSILGKERLYQRVV